jgi:hypothetical protein
LKRVFIYGGVSRNFKEVSEPFVEAAGGNKTRIALLVQGGGAGEALSLETLSRS